MNKTSKCVEWYKVGCDSYNWNPKGKKWGEGSEKLHLEKKNPKNSKFYEKFKHTKHKSEGKKITSLKYYIDKF